MVGRGQSLLNGCWRAGSLNMTSAGVVNKYNKRVKQVGEHTNMLEVFLNNIYVSWRLGCKWEVSSGEALTVSQDAPPQGRSGQEGRVPYCVSFLPWASRPLRYAVITSMPRIK